MRRVASTYKINCVKSGRLAVSPALICSRSDNVLQAARVGDHRFPLERTPISHLTGGYNEDTRRKFLRRVKLNLKVLRKLWRISERWQRNARRERFSWCVKITWSGRPIINWIAAWESTRLIIATSHSTKILSRSWLLQRNIFLSLPLFLSITRAGFDIMSPIVIAEAWHTNFQHVSYLKGIRVKRNLWALYVSCNFRWLYQESIYRNSLSALHYIALYYANAKSGITRDASDVEMEKNLRIKRYHPGKNSSTMRQTWRTPHRQGASWFPTCLVSSIIVENVPLHRLGSFKSLSSGLDRIIIQYCFPLNLILRSRS